MKQKLDIRYIVELMITLLLILFIITVLVKAFAYSRKKTEEAKRLNYAVLAAENVAEVLRGTKDLEEFEETFLKMENVVIEKSGSTVTVSDPENGKFAYGMTVRIEQETEEGSTGHMDRYVITVSSHGEEVYVLKTGRYLKEGEPND